MKTQLEAITAARIDAERERARNEERSIMTELDAEIAAIDREAATPPVRALGMPRAYLRRGRAHREWYLRANGRQGER
jgi:hypothetical protein